MFYAHVAFLELPRAPLHTKRMASPCSLLYVGLRVVATPPKGAAHGAF